MSRLMIIVALLCACGCSNSEGTAFRTGRSGPSPSQPRSTSETGARPAVSCFEPLSVDRLPDVDKLDCGYEKAVIEIEGVVSLENQVVWSHSDTDDYEVHCFSFADWRRPGEPLTHEELTILRPVDPDRDCFSDYPKLSLQRIKVLLSKDRTRAVFAGETTNGVEENQLQAVATELAKPIVINTPRFGDLTLDRSRKEYVGEASWNGADVEISFYTAGNDDISGSLELAERLWVSQKQWKQKVDDCAVKHLLGLKNETWLEEGESAVTSDQFKARMKLKSISIDPDGSLTFWHSDGELFWGHMIRVSGSIDQGVDSANILG